MEQNKYDFLFSLQRWLPNAQGQGSEKMETETIQGRRARRELNDKICQIWQLVTELAKRVTWATSMEKREINRCFLCFKENKA